MKNTIILTIANEKGGVGKTTTTVTLAQGLAQLNYKVLIIDTDAQGQVAPLLGLPKSDDLFRLLVAEIPLHKCIQYVNSRHHIGVVRGHKKTAKAKNILSTGPIPAPIDTFARHLQPAVDVVDYILIDTAPSLLDSLGLGTLWAAHYVIVPTHCERLSLQGVTNIIGTIQTLRERYNAQTKLLAILPTSYRVSTTEHRLHLDRLHQAYGTRLVWPAIPQATAITQASAYAIPIFDYDPHGKATARYKMALELLINATQT